MKNYTNFRHIKIHYCDKPFIKRIFKNSLPLIIGTILTGIIAFSDNFMVGILQAKGSGELASLSLAAKFVNIINIFVQGAIAMFGFLIMQYVGDKNIQKTRETVKLTIIFSLATCFLFIIIGWFLNNEIMHFFQGKNFNNISTASGTAQKYLRTLMFTTLPVALLSIYLIGLNAFEKQKIIIPLSVFTIIFNIFLNWLFYQVFKIGLQGIAFSTLIVKFLALFYIIFFISKKKWKNYILFNIFQIFKIDTQVLKIGIRKFLMAIQVIFWGLILIGIKIIYSRWFGDIANNQLALIGPISMIFYSSLNAIATTKGKFVGQEIGKKDPIQAYINDKKINLYTFLVAVFEGLLLIILSYPLSLIWTNASQETKFGATLILIFIGLTYPTAALSKTLLGSFKVAGMGKIIILSNGLFALIFEFLIPFILYIIYVKTGYIDISFWQLFLISRLLKLIKLPTTIYFWRKLSWLTRAI